MEEEEPVEEESVFPCCCPNLTEETVLCGKVTCGHVYNVLMFVMLSFMGWAVLFSFGSPEAALPPDGELFVLYTMLVASSAAGWLVSKFYVPPNLAMMCVGMVYGNTGLFTPGETVSRELIVNARLAAITCVLVRAGLAVNAEAMMQYHWMIVRIGFLPMMAEMLAVAFAAYLILDFSWLWSFILGSIICAASPAVAVHCILQLAESGYGTDKDIKSIAIAAISLDSVTAIVVIDLLLTFQYSCSHGEIKELWIKATLQILVGFLLGIAYGFFISFFPHKYYPGVYFFRILFLCSGAVSFIIGSRQLKHDPAGYFACLISTFLASQIWQRLDHNDEQNPANDVMRILWNFLQPVLFGLIGAEFKVELIHGEVIIKSIIILSIGIVFRLIVAFISSFGIDLTAKEKIFMTIAWIPKATVQAAFGPLVVDLSQSYEACEKDKETATLIAVISAVSILVFGSIGTLGVQIGGRNLLNKSIPRSSTRGYLFQHPQYPAHQRISRQVGNVGNSENSENL